MERPTYFELKGVEYYSAQDIKKFDVAFARGTGRSVRGYIEKKNMKPENYIFCTHSRKNGYTVLTDVNNLPKKCTMLFTRDWVESNVPSLANHHIVVEYVTEAPPLINLEEKEKFHDDDGNAHDIETRGERTPKGIYFLARDVAKAFGKPNIERNIADSSNGYTKDEHYKNFLRKESPNTESPAIKKLFITYKGMLKILFSSRSGNQGKFVDWAVETLFTVQMGSVEQKQKLSKSLYGIPQTDIKRVLKTSAGAIPCVYVFYLGLVKDLRSEMNIDSSIPDDHWVIKYGRTKDLSSRSINHNKEYGSIDGVNIHLHKYCYVDTHKASKAEVRLKEYFVSENVSVTYKDYTEIFTFDPKNEKRLAREFHSIHLEFADEIKALNTMNELVKKDAEVTKARHERDIAISQSETKLAQSETRLAQSEKREVEAQLELANIKLKIATNQGLPSL